MTPEGSIELRNEVTKTEENVTEIAPRRMTNIETKRLAAKEERRRRLINKGVLPEKVDQVMAQQDYDNLSTEEKLRRFQNLMSKALQGLQQDIVSLQHNDAVIADSMDINLRAMARGLAKAGVSLEEQGVIIKEVSQEMTAERKQEQAKSVDQAEKDLIEKEVSATSTEDTPTQIPDGATVFSDS